MATIRHEINILDSVAGGASGVVLGADGIIKIDKTQYNGTLAIYFEAQVSTAHAANTLTLRRIGTTTDDGSVSVASTGLVRTADISSSVPSTATSYGIFSASTTVRIKSARVIIIQTATTLTNTETQIEIGNASNTTATVDTALTNPKYWKYDASKWDGTKTFYFESTFMSGTSKSAATMTLQTSTDILAPSWSNVASSAVTTTGTVATLVRSGALTLVDGNWYRAVMKAGNSKSGITTYNAKIILDQVGANTTATYYFDATDAGPTDIGTVWSNDANAFDGDTATNASVSTTLAANKLNGTGTNSPTSGNNITQVRARINGTCSAGNSLYGQIYSSGTALHSIPFGAPSATSGWGSYVTLNVPSGGWTWTLVNNLEVRFGLAADDISKTMTAARAEVEVTYSDGTTALTKLEPQYLLANTLFAAGTGLQNFLTDWDSTEWSGLTNTYYFQAEAANGSTSDVTLNQADGGGAVTNSTLTNIDNAQISAAMTMPGDENLDVTATTNAGDVAAARILVTTVINTASCALTGTVTNDTEADIVTGGSTIILTLTGDTFIAAGTGPIGTTANTQALIDGITSAGAEGTGWNAVVRAGIETTDVVRTSDTVATITLDAEATYNITANETITATIPAAVLTGGVALVASPTFTITATVTNAPGTLLMMGMGV